MADPLDLSRARVLVTWGAGFIGSNFVHRLLELHPGAHVVVLDALTYAGRRENLDGLSARQHTFVHGDIRDPDAVARAMAGCDVVLNFAAESHVDRSIETPGEFIQTDVYGVFVLTEEARRIGVRRFVQVSTDEVYGDNELSKGNTQRNSIKAFFLQEELAEVEKYLPYLLKKVRKFQFSILDAKNHFIKESIKEIKTFFHIAKKRLDSE